MLEAKNFTATVQKEINQYAAVVGTAKGLVGKQLDLLSLIFSYMEYTNFQHGTDRHILIVTDELRNELAERAHVSSSYVNRTIVLFNKIGIINRIYKGIYEVNADIVGTETWDDLVHVHAVIELLDNADINITIQLTHA